MESILSGGAGLQALLDSTIQGHLVPSFLDGDAGLQALLASTIQGNQVPSVLGGDAGLQALLDPTLTVKVLQHVMRVAGTDTSGLVLRPLLSVLESVIQDTPRRAVANHQASRSIVAAHLRSGAAKKVALEGSVVSFARQHWPPEYANWTTFAPSIAVGVLEVKPTKVAALLAQVVLLLPPVEHLRVTPTPEQIQDQLRFFERNRVGFRASTNLVRGRDGTVVEDYAWPVPRVSRYYPGPVRAVFKIDPDNGGLVALNISIAGEVFTPASGKHQWELARLQVDTVSFIHHNNFVHFAQHVWCNHVVEWARSTFAPGHPAYLLLLSFSEGMLFNDHMAIPITFVGPRLIDGERFLGTSRNTVTTGIDLLANSYTGSAWMTLQKDGWLGEEEQDQDQDHPVDFPYRDCMLRAWNLVSPFVDRLVSARINISSAQQKDYRAIFHRDLGLTTWRDVIKHYIMNVVAHGIIHSALSSWEVALRGYDPRTDRDGGIDVVITSTTVQSVGPHDVFADNLDLYLFHISKPADAVELGRRFRQEVHKLFREFSSLDEYNARAWDSISSSLSR
jgi:hypothetical protein